MQGGHAQDQKNMAHELSHSQVGMIVLFGSGETSPTGRKVFEEVFHRLPYAPRLALLETPAGFELNSQQVISRVADFINHRLQNHAPCVDIIPARKRGTTFSPDDPKIVAPLLQADLIFMGPGSPSYAIRQLRDSLAWYYLIARHRLGAVLALASAATVAFSAYALPVYEIYKVGEELHWIEGLDFFKLYGMDLVFVPHWNNHEGGAELDTSRCFMGQERFMRLMEILPEEKTIIGLDEKTALIMDPAKGECQVMGVGCVTLIHTGHLHVNKGERPPTMKTEKVTGTDEDLAIIAEQRSGHVHQYHSSQAFPMSELGHFHPYYPEASLPPGIWQKALEASFQCTQKLLITPPVEVQCLAEKRVHARQTGNWENADALREQIYDLGWEIVDTKEGPLIKPRSQD
jgi:cyanophycinase-like exopeptidase